MDHKLCLNRWLDYVQWSLKHDADHIDFWEWREAWERGVIR